MENENSVFVGSTDENLTEFLEFESENQFCFLDLFNGNGVNDFE
ncbi:MAG: hypothetical protein WC917_02630 [Bacilli bacterium]|jgi:hypothetical protein